MIPKILPVIKDLVLLGAGHSHVILLKKLAMQPIPGLQITVISPDPETPYSGMLPGVVAGHYTVEDIHIDLAPLCRLAGARFIKARAININPTLQQVGLLNRPSFDYDLLSINVGITPSLGQLDIAPEQIIPVKPIGGFLERWQVFYDGLKQPAANSDKNIEIGVVGAGAGGVELCLAISRRLKKAGLSNVSLHLVCDSEQILKTYSDEVQDRFLQQLQACTINLHCGFDAREFKAGQLIASSGAQIALDEVFWVTSAAAPGWLANTGLPLDEQGFVKVRDTLQVVGFDNVFAAGDIAHVLAHPRPKAGVYAVRQGPVLYRNIRRLLFNRKPRPFTPQKEFLALISTGEKYAVAARNGYSVAGGWVWHWKNWIDQQFMRQFADLHLLQVNSMQPTKIKAAYQVLYQVLFQPQMPGNDFDAQMQCGGCGSKVSGDVLHEVLQEIGIEPQGLDDAAIFAVPQGKLMLHSVDTFKTFYDDPYLLAQIAVHHALSDIFAMGGEAVTALAIITVPYAKPAKTRALLRQLLAGTHKALQASGVKLIGGHTTEGAELSVGFAVNGLVDEKSIMQKGGLCPGQSLILTKPLGTGVLFAADMQCRASGRAVDQALASMNQSNQAAMQVFKKFAVQSCTDITGFGLAGHLTEMLAKDCMAATLDLDSLPVLDTVADLFHQAKIQSTLHAGNQRSANAVQPNNHRLYPLLFDPQTSGGLLAAVDEDDMPQVLLALKAAGYEHACCIGMVAAPIAGCPGKRLVEAPVAGPDTVAEPGFSENPIRIYFE
ncbi:MAG: selenide, water dikinase SelD [Pseudomonadales bacterium]|nr:selenide, water dikinase SelD [Pseudomonadales bacterium]